MATKHPPEVSVTAELRARVARLEDANAALAAALEEIGRHNARVTLAPESEWLTFLPEQARAALSDTGEGCRYCRKPPDGPMLSGVGHAPCIIRRLRELLDPDWEPGCGYEPLALGTLGALDALEVK